MAHSEDHVIQGMQRVARQREIVADLDCRGQDVSEVEPHLTFERQLSMSGAGIGLGTN